MEPTNQPLEVKLQSVQRIQQLYDAKQASGFRIIKLSLVGVGDFVCGDQRRMIFPKDVVPFEAK